MQWLRTSAKIAVLMVLSIVAMVVVIVAGVQTNVGKKLLVSAVNHGMAGRATVRGLRGAIPWDMTIAEIELQDPAGTWGVSTARFKFSICQSCGCVRGFHGRSAGESISGMGSRASWE